jgi:hypothetical protein
MAGLATDMQGINAVMQFLLARYLAIEVCSWK